MVKHIFNNDKLDQMKERTTNMFQRCGGSGSPNREFPRERAYEDPSELKIHTLESTYRDPLPARYNFINCRQYVSDSNIFMHRDEDWYREPKPTLGSSNVYSTSTNFNVFNSRYPTIDVATIETVNVSNSGLSNGLNRFKSFLGVDENVQTAEDPVEPSKFDRFKKMFKRKNAVSIEAPLPAANLTPEDRIVRMKTLFGDKPKPKPEGTPKQPKPLLQMKTLFKKDASCQTDDVTTMSRFKKIFSFNKTNDEEKVDDRQIFSRQSSIPAREEDRTASRLPLCWTNTVKQVRASLTRSRVDDVEIPDCTSDLGPTKKKKTVKFGKASSWRWRAAEDPRAEPNPLHENFTQVSSNHDNIIY